MLPDRVAAEGLNMKPSTSLPAFTVGATRPDAVGRGNSHAVRYSRRSEAGGRISEPSCVVLAVSPFDGSVSQRR